MPGATRQRPKHFAPDTRDHLGPADRGRLRGGRKATFPPRRGLYRALINYFFRCKIDVVPDPNDPTGYLIKNLGPETMNGTFEFHYDDARTNLAGRQRAAGTL